MSATFEPDGVVVGAGLAGLVATTSWPRQVCEYSW